MQWMERNAMSVVARARETTGRERYEKENPNQSLVNLIVKEKERKRQSGNFLRPEVFGMRRHILEFHFALILKKKRFTSKRFQVELNTVSNWHDTWRRETLDEMNKREVTIQDRDERQQVNSPHSFFWKERVIQSFHSGRPWTRIRRLKSYSPTQWRITINPVVASWTITKEWTAIWFSCSLSPSKFLDFVRNHCHDCAVFCFPFLSFCCVKSNKTALSSIQLLKHKEFQQF